MLWFSYSVICLLSWGFADIFYKKGNDADDKNAYLKTAVWVGLVMGAAAFFLMPFAETAMTPEQLWNNALRYSPASLSYILSMIIGYAGLRYLEVSIVSPVQNASGALSMLAMMGYFLASGKIMRFSDEFSVLDILGTVLIVAGVIRLAVVENEMTEINLQDCRYRSGIPALLFPLGYCLFDTIGTAADGIILDEETGLGLGEIDVIILYGLTFLIVGAVCWIMLYIRQKKPYNPFTRSEFPKLAAACLEENGQIFYVYAMAARPLLAAPMIASYCIVSVLLSRLLLKEKLTSSQYRCVAAVLAGIVLLGISEGLAA